MRTITQRELRNESAAILREVQAGQSRIVTRNGTPVAELKPVSPRRFVPRAVARAYGRIHAALRGHGRGGRRRFGGLLIGATALAHALPLHTRHPLDFEGLGQLVGVRVV